MVKSALKRSAVQALRQRRAKKNLLTWLRVLERHNNAAEAAATADGAGLTAAAASSSPTSKSFAPEDSSSGGRAPKYKYMILMGKALVVVSHYPFFNLYRTFLCQLYRVSLSDSPLPIERYIANFCSEIPLPPRGQVEVKVALPDKVRVLRRAPKNDLPSLDFSLRPLLSLLDVDNVLAVFECLLAEAKVCLVSRHLSLLAPVATGLVSLLFPFEWQGAFIPVMPASMIEVLDAPVPFFVGVHADALESLYGVDRPKEVVYVFLDEDRVILPQAEYRSSRPSLVSNRTGSRGDGYWRAFDKVRKQLTKLIERNSIGVGSRRSDGSGSAGGRNDSYSRGGRARSATVDPLAAAAADAAFPQNEHLLPIYSFGLETGILELRRGSSVSGSNFGSPRSPLQAKQYQSAGRERSSRFGISRSKRDRSRPRPKSSGNSDAVQQPKPSPAPSAMGNVSDGAASSGGELDDEIDDADATAYHDRGLRRRTRSMSPFRDRGSGNNSPASGTSAGAASGAESGGREWRGLGGRHWELGGWQW